MSGLVFRLAALAGLAAAPLAAQPGPSALDRGKPPTLSGPPALHLPALARGSLANGIGLELVEHHALPLVQVTLVVRGGTKLDAAQPGIATFTTRMLTEGAGARDANALSSELTFLGAQLAASAGADAFVVSLNVPKRSLGAALDLMADVAMRPTFRATDLVRQRDLRLASILQRKDQPTQLASLAFNQLVFPAGHPYHQPSDGDSSSTAALDSAHVRAFYERAFAPSRATFVVVGDVTEPEMRALLAARFGAWKSATAPTALPQVTTKPVTNAKIQLYLLDKPGAAQSVIILGAPGTDRLNPDYPAITVMNTLLGGSFSSRLNANLRETKGYTYGIGSAFRWAPLPGPFSVSTSVRTDVTDSSLVEIFKELRALRDTPVNATELARGKAYVALAVPGEFETNAQVASQLVSLGYFGLPLASVTDFVARVGAVTAADVQRVARKYLPVDNATLVVVGDVAKIRPGIEALKFGPVSLLDVSTIAR
jgi:predicted Zn-dependent peptidase